MEEGLRRLLQFPGESLECERVYVFEEMDRQHIRNTYEWCREGIPSGIEQLPYVAKKDLSPWYMRLADGDTLIEPDVERLRQNEPLIYGILQQQKIHSIILSPLLSQGRMAGLLGADNPPPEKMEHISVLFDVLAYFVCSLVSQRELHGHTGIPVIFLTAHVDAQTAREGIAAGGCTFLTKPYRLEELRMAVAGAVKENTETCS